MSHWLHPAAEAELGDAAVYYAEHASLAIAEAFLAEYELVRDLVVEDQQRGPHLNQGLAPTTSTAFRTHSSTKKTQSAVPRSTQLRIKAASRGIGRVAPERLAPPGEAWPVVAAS